MNDKIEEVINSPWFIPAVVGVASFGSGLGLGFFLGKRKAEAEVEEIHFIDEVAFEIDEVTDSPEESSEPVRPPKVVIDEKVAEEKGIVKPAGLADLRPSEEPEDDEHELPPIQFTNERDDVDDDDDEPLVTVVRDEDHPIVWNWEEELEKRTETAPYILHREEFEADELNFSQLALTYYAADETLADEDNQMIYNHSDVTGPLEFGHGSGNEDLVYVRNHERRAEYEITRVDSRYSIEVLGLSYEEEADEADLRHSNSLMRFRVD